MRVISGALVGIATWFLNAGMYILSAEILEAVPAAQPCSLEREIFPALVGQGLYALPYEEATFLDIGTPEDLSRAGELMS